MKIIVVQGQDGEAMDAKLRELIGEAPYTSVARTIKLNPNSPAVGNGRKILITDFAPDRWEYVDRELVPNFKDTDFELILATGEATIPVEIRALPIEGICELEIINLYENGNT